MKQIPFDPMVEMERNTKVILRSAITIGILSFALCVIIILNADMFKEQAIEPSVKFEVHGHAVTTTFKNSYIIVFDSAGNARAGVHAKEKHSTKRIEVGNGWFINEKGDTIRIK